MPSLAAVLLTLTALSGCGSAVILAPGNPDGGGGSDAAVVFDRLTPADRPSLPDTVFFPDFVVARDAPRACARQSDCRSGEACVGPAGCGVPWACVPALGRACTEDLAPFCGCDGVNFFGSSSCPERPYVHRGLCEAPPPPPACRLPDGGSCPVGERCSLDRCTACTCRAPGELSCVNVCLSDAGARTCRTGSDCGPNELCMGPEGCGVPWTCRAGPIGCTADLSPFCGCDGTTFFGSSSCPSRPYQHRGACPGPDGGPGGCSIRGVHCPYGSRCQIDRCTVCTCYPDGTSGCAVSSDCVLDAGVRVDAGVTCDPMQAMGEGDCDLFLGWAWSGGACRGLSGCRCVGPDCGRLLRSRDECEARFERCPRVGP